MTKIDEYFLGFSDKLVYLDLKESASYGLLNDIALPIYTKDLEGKIITGQMQNKVDLETILQAMIINIAIDPDFKYNENYVEVLEKYIKNITSYTATIAVKERKDDLKALLLTRGGYIINPFDVYNAYNYARLLWPRAFVAKSEYKDEFIKEALEILQKIIDQDENFPLSYYELANIYENLGDYIKARNYYNKALNKTDDEAAKEEVRNKLFEINENAEIEESLYYIGKGNYNEAIKRLTRLLSQTARADAYYYLGVCYQNIGQYEKSIEAFQDSLDNGGEFRELYNDYAVSLYLDEREIDSLEIINQGLEIFPEDPRLIYNRLQININLGNLIKAKSDLENLLTYDDLSDELYNNLMIIKEQFKM